MVDPFQSILGIEEGEDSIAEIGEEVMELLLGIESVSLIEGRIIVANVFEELLVEVVPQGRDQEDHAAHQTKGFE
jgi:hypothetical protein